MPVEAISMKAVVVGATSAVGHFIVEALEANGAWTSIVLVLRKSTSDFDGFSKVTIKLLSSLDELATLATDLHGFDAMFCSLGAYAKLDGPEVLKKVDLDYVAASASLAESSGITSFALVSAPEADATLPETVTGWALYKRVKGLAEEAVKQKNIKFIYIFRPGVLFGRKEAKRVASVRSKGRWDTMVSVFDSCCCCVRSAVGIRCSTLGEVMVEVVTKHGFLGESGGNVTISNADIIKYSTSNAVE